jgi:hypothetical protein
MPKASKIGVKIVFKWFGFGFGCYKRQNYKLILNFNKLLTKINDGSRGHV